MSKKSAKLAAEAHTDITVFGIIQGIAEDSHLRSSSAHKAAEKIVKICRSEMQNQLSAYDNAMEKVQS